MINKYNVIFREKKLDNFTEIMGQIDLRQVVRVTDEELRYGTGVEVIEKIKDKIRKQMIDEIYGDLNKYIWELYKFSSKLCSDSRSYYELQSIVDRWNAKISGEPISNAVGRVGKSCSGSSPAPETV